MSKGKFALQQEKEQDLEEALRNIYSNCRGRIHYKELSRRLATHPSRRFWVSAETAYVVIKRMLAGATLEAMRDTKRNMYMEIYRRVCKMREENPDKELEDIVDEVVEQPAPSFYITNGTAYVLITRIKRERRRCRTKKQ